MIEIKELRANKLPNYTSLYFKVPYNNVIIEELKQQDIYNYNTTTTVYEFPITRLYFLINLLNRFDSVRFIPYKEPIKALVKLDNTSRFKIKPYSYQLEGIEYGLNHDGWLLLDDQGLGKTLQIIYLAQMLKAKGLIEHCLVICGVNGLKFNWAAEIEKFTNLDYTILGQRTNSKGKIVVDSVDIRCSILKNKIKEFFVITNIETLQNSKFLTAFKNSKNSFGMIVLDEAHRCKDPSSKASKTLLKMTSAHNIALTGTIIMNNPENAYVPLKWTGNLTSNFSTFKKMYNVYGGYGGVQVIGYKNLDLLQEHISKCSLRRLKEEVLDLPDKNYSIEYVEMGNKQRALYEEVERGIAEELNLLPANKQMTIMQEITINMRLRQITAFPGILNSEVKESAKLDRAEQLVEEITSQGDKIVIFCTFKPCASELYKRLSKYNPVSCTGDDDDITISANKDKFQNDINCKVLIATWQKMGTGHTLTAANYVIFIDTPWTDADFKQCSDRIYRIGQSKKCFIITLVTKNTYDERVLDILNRKELLSDYIIDKKDSILLNNIVDY